MNSLVTTFMRRSVILISLIQASLSGQTTPRPFKLLLPEWTHNERWWQVVVMPHSSPGHIIETARVIHGKYSKLSFYLVDTERGIEPFNSWARDSEGKNFPLEWATKHYLGVVRETMHHSGIRRGGVYMQWALEPGTASSFPTTPLR